MRGPRQLRSTDSTARMLDSALDLVAAGGLSAATVAAVAHRSDTSNGALYHRFGDRLGLLVAAQERFLTQIENELGTAVACAAAQADDTTALDVLVEAFHRVFTDHRRLFRAFLIEGREERALHDRGIATSHRVAGATTAWLQSRFGCPPQAADLAYRLLFSLGATRALFDDTDLTPSPVHVGELRHSLRNALLGTVRP
jgi:AcrR family transcriptional regulator